MITKSEQVIKDRINLILSEIQGYKDVKDIVPISSTQSAHLDYMIEELWDSYEIHEKALIMEKIYQDANHI